MRRVSIFDLDHTLVRGNSSFAFCVYLIFKREVPFFTLFYALIWYIRHRYFGMSLTELHHRVFARILKGRSLKKIENYIDTFVRQYLPRAVNLVVLSHLRRAQHLGDFTMILSNSPSFLVSKVASVLGVDDWKATQYSVDANSCLSHVDSVLQGEEKAACVQEIIKTFKIEKKHVTAYSDSHLDLPFLLAAGTPIVVGPDKKLKVFSQIHQWMHL